MNNQQANLSRQHDDSAVETLGPKQKPKRFKSLKAKALLALTGVLLLAGFTGGGYAVKSDMNNQRQLKAEISDQPQQDASISPLPKPKQTKENAVADPEQKNQTPPAQSVNQAKPIIVFQPEDVFSDQEKQALNDRLIDPMIDYQPNVFAAIRVEMYSPDKFVGGTTDYKYIVTTIGQPDSGGNGEFLFGSKTKALEWWQPDCLETCEFSPQYQQKYPAVIEQSQQ